MAPGTTDFVAAYLRRHTTLAVGNEIHVAHAPERIAAGRFFEEIHTLPCIIGGVGAQSGAAVGDLFSVFGAPIVQTTPVQAELAKIWTNILRYSTFALPNLLMMDCEQYDANVFEVIDLINRDYPRGGIAKPGFTAGTCLRKDFAFSEERSYAPGMLLAVSRVNESVPLFLLRGLRRRIGPLEGRRVCVLGLAFKADTDDDRDSLAHKLVRMLERELAEVAVHDPLIHAATVAFEDALADADAVVVATNHSAFRTPAALARIVAAASPECLIVDPWDCWGFGQLFIYAAEMHRCRGATVSRVLVTGGAGMIGQAIVRQLMRDPDFEVRVSDQREAPDWIREGAEVHTGDLRDAANARTALEGATHVIHCAAIVGGIANFHRLPYTLTEVNNALYNA